MTILPSCVYLSKENINFCHRSGTWCFKIPQWHHILMLILSHKLKLLWFWLNPNQTNIDRQVSKLLLFKNDVDVRIARIFNTFGPRMHIHDGRVVSNLIVQALKGNPLTIYGDGKITRSFQYVRSVLLFWFVKWRNVKTLFPVWRTSGKEFVLICSSAKRSKNIVHTSGQLKSCFSVCCFSV